MRVSQICIGRFHHFHLARQLERHGLLDRIFTGFPRFKLRDEAGIPPGKIRPFPWLQVPYMALAGRLPPATLQRLARFAAESLDGHASRHLGEVDVLIALSGAGLRSGGQVQNRGGHYICDRGSTHIRFQRDILRQEHAKWGLKFDGIDEWTLRREEAEYDRADRVTVPSEFTRRTFLEQGVPLEKMIKVPYGARLERFHPTGRPDPEKFTVLFVGQVTLRKGFLYLLKAFQRIRHPAKELIVVGAVSEEIRSLLTHENLEFVQFLGPVSNDRLPGHYSRAHVCVVPSIEEGLCMVMGEAMACGCPVTATPNTGAEDFFEDGHEGCLVPVGDVTALHDSLESLVQDPPRRDRMAQSALDRVKKLGGWDHYGDQYARLVLDLGGRKV